MSWIPSLAKRHLAAHKGDFGRIGIVAGSKGMLGAALMSAKAAMRSGAGVVYLLTIESAVDAINAAIPEIVVVPLLETDGALGVSCLGEIWQAKDEYGFSAMGVGPGLGRRDDTQQLIRDLLPMVCGRDCPVILDADGLYPHDAHRLESYPKGTVVVTPHSGEFEHVFGFGSADSSARLATAEKAAELCKQVVVLKGAGTVVAQVGELSYVNSTGNPGMATAGAGDVLLGMTTAFCGHGMSPMESAKTAVYLHGKAGDFAAAELGEYSAMATDIIERIPNAILGVSQSS